MKDVRDALMVGRTSEGQLVRRPLSPHLQVYRWPVTMFASILNRATGIALAVGSLLLVWWLVAAATSAAAFAGVQHFMASPIGLLLLLGWTFSLCFHLFSGIRHIFWDVGWGFEHRALNAVTWLVLAASVLATVLLWVLAFAVMGS